MIYKTRRRASHTAKVHKATHEALMQDRTGHSEAGLIRFQESSFLEVSHGCKYKKKSFKKATLVGYSQLSTGYQA